MSIVIEIKVNAEKVARAFKQAPRNLGKNLSIAVVKSAQVVERETKLTAPVDTHRLRGSISSRIKPLSAIISPHVNYAVWVHEGHRQEVGRYVPAIGKRLVQPFVKGNPFMERGAKASERRIQGLFTEAVDNTLKTIEGSA